MSLYEDFNQANTTEQTFLSNIENLTVQRQMLVMLESGLTLKAAKIIYQCVNDKLTNQTSWDRDREAWGNIEETKCLGLPAFLLNDTTKLEKMLKQLSDIGQIRLMDIMAYEYPIYAFNTKPEHFISLKNDRVKFTEVEETLYGLQMALTIGGVKHLFAINISIYETVVNKTGNSSSRRKELKDVVFPYVDNWFQINASEPTRANIQMFIESCRASVRGL